MAVRKATLEQLGHKVKEEKIITVSAKAAGEEAAAWAAKCAEHKQRIPYVLCYYVSLALQSAPGCQNRKHSCAVIRKERAEELARAGMGNNAARKRRAMAVLKSALRSSETMLLWWRNRHMSTYVGHLHATFRKIL